MLREHPNCFAIDRTPSPLRAITRISTACSWVSIDGTKKAVIVYQVGHFYFDDVGQYYFGANIHFVIDLALRGDFVAHIARQALDGKKDYKAQTPAELAKTNPGAATTALRQSSQELLEMFVSRAVDNFEVYLVAMVRLVLNKEPRILSYHKQALASLRPSVLNAPFRWSSRTGSASASLN